MPAKKSATKTPAVEQTDKKQSPLDQKRADETITTQPQDIQRHNEEHIQALEHEVKALKTELTDQHDKLLRAYADYQNYQKRMDKELASRDFDLRRRYLSEIIDFKDILAKAAEDPHPHDGIKRLLATLDHFLDKEGVRPLDCKGKPFDYQQAHALSTMEHDESPEGTVLEEVKKGYLLGEALLRPAQVIVSRKKE